MVRQVAWRLFAQTGKVSHYLFYAAVSQRQYGLVIAPNSPVTHIPAQECQLSPEVIYMPMASLEDTPTQT